MTAENQNEGPLQEGTDQRNLSIHGNVDESFVILGDHNTIHQGPSYYTTNVFGSCNANQFPSWPSRQLSQQEYRWRQVLLQNVKHYWIEGVLERSLHNQALIELGLEERAQAAVSPISGAEEFATKTAKPFPAGTQATDIFDNLGPGRTLLILGEPGAGKTTILLKLAQTLITRIGDDFSQPMPVILNLSSWAKKKKSIAEWLVQDLYETFQVSKALGAAWIRGEQLTLCLDGLDEVAAEHRNACIQALNHFLKTHGRTEVVVCSRIRDYEALSEQLRVRCAIYVKPLTAQQIDQYLEQAGKKLSALKDFLANHCEIKEFARTPLILSVMSLAYQGYSLNELPNSSSREVFRQRLFDAYIERMFQRRGTTHQYEDKQAQRWLSWIARQISHVSQTVFFIENLQPTLLRSRTQRIRYQLESSLITSLFIGLPVGVTVFSLDNLLTGLIYGLSSALGAGILDISTMVDIRPVETLRWSWQEFELTDYLLVIAKGGLIVGLTSGLGSGLAFGARSGLILGMVCTLGFVFTVGLVSGVSGPGMGNKTKPNQGIWISAKNAGMFTLIFGLVGGLVGLILNKLLGDLIGNINHSVTGFLLGGLTGGMMGGATACLRHFCLRLRLYNLGFIPWNYARFLDYATERLFLQNVGGGYIFIHRMLLEHFSQMELEQKLLK